VESIINIEELFNELINMARVADDSSKLCEFLKNEIYNFPLFKKYSN
jgi:hypothetical protein